MDNAGRICSPILAGEVGNLGGRLGALLPIDRRVKLQSERMGVRKKRTKTHVALDCECKKEGEDGKYIYMNVIGIVNVN